MKRAERFLASVDAVNVPDYGAEGRLNAIEAALTSMVAHSQSLGEGEYAKQLEHDWNMALREEQLKLSKGNVLTKDGKKLISKMVDKYANMCKRREQMLLAKLQDAATIIEELVAELDMKK
jgi:hypothetical protein